jgi:hypothetical protein
MTTTIYLDVDGVLNAVTRHVPTTTGWAEYARRKVNSFPIMFAPALIEALNELAARDDVTIKWLTTWEHDAANDLSPALGINGKDWEVLTGDQDAWHGAGWWKLEAIRADVEATTPDKFFWIDDDLGAELPALDWVATRPEGVGITPNMRHGMTTEHVDWIRAAVTPAEVAA